MTPTLIFKSVYILGLVLQIVIRSPYQRAVKKNTITDKRVDTKEIIILVCLFIGNLLLPFLYIFTPWLDFANYSLPDWTGYLGILLLLSALALFWRGHADLGLNWSPSLEMRENHTLVTQGIYAYIRHPMYASQWLWVIAQPLLLYNWLAGPLGLVAFLPLFLLRVPREEKMMLEHFGDQYRAYMQRAGSVLPRLTK